MSKKVKKLLVFNIPYLVLGLLFTKLPEAWRYTSGADFGEKILHLGEGFSQAFEVPLPSFYPTDLLIGLAIEPKRIVPVTLLNTLSSKSTRTLIAPIWAISSDL